MNRFKNSQKLYDSFVSYRFFAVFILISSALKYFLKLRYNLGIPGVEAIPMGIPMLSGLLSLFIGIGLFTIFNIALYSAAIRGRVFYFFLFLLFAIANSIVDLLYGSKLFIMIQFAVLLYFSLEVLYVHDDMGHVRKLRRRLVALCIPLAVLGLAALELYKYLNFYRFGLLQGFTPFEAVQFALESETAQSRSSLLEIYNRINGADILASVVAIRDRLPNDQTWRALFDGSFTSEFSLIVMNFQSSDTKFGVTQFGYFYGTNGFAGIFLGCVFYGLVIWLTQKVVFSNTVDTRIQAAAAPIWSLLIVKMLMGSGNFDLWLKEVFVFALVIIFTNLAIRIGPSALGSSPKRTRTAKNRSSRRHSVS